MQHFKYVNWRIRFLMSRTGYKFVAEKADIRICRADEFKVLTTVPKSILVLVYLSSSANAIYFVSAAPSYARTTIRWKISTDHITALKFSSCRAVL